MKRLPFALIALSLSIPAVACLNTADEDVAASDNDLSQATKDACNFAFSEVTTPVYNDPTKPNEGALLKIGTASATGITESQQLVWGDFDGDGHQDFAFVKGREEVQVYRGDGNKKGNFVKSKSAKKLPKIPGRDRTAIAIVASGDFNGDGKSDLVAIATSTKQGAPAADLEASKRGDLTILYGAKADGSLEAPETVPSLAAPITEKTSFNIAGDLDGDGKDDLVLTTEKGEIVAFGGGDKGTLVPAASGFTSDHVRSLAFISPKTATKPAALVIATPVEVASITFDAQHAATVTKKDVKLPPKSASRWASTADGEIAIIAPKGLHIVPSSPALQQAPTMYENLPGELIGAVDFDANKQSELLYKVDDSKLFAACGASEHTDQVVATPLKVAYGNTVLIVGKTDVNQDGKADLITLDISDDEATRGTVKVYLAAGKQDPAPSLQVFASPAPVVVDAGAPVLDSSAPTDSGPKDGGSANPPDATVPKDAGPVNPPLDAGAKDSGTTNPPADAGVKDSGTTVKDAGAQGDDDDDRGDDDDDSVKPDGDDDDDGSEEGPGTDEGSGKNKPKTKPSPSKPGAATSSSGASLTGAPVATDDGCSAAPVGTSGASTSAIGGLFAAMMLLVRRRRNRK